MGEKIDKKSPEQLKIDFEIKRGNYILESFKGKPFDKQVKLKIIPGMEE
ncbi:MAG: hypothetical protein Q9M94_06945 [Candidatus Gracilibacteria bacterium]|nr:hypothetical protein [Candidatus Gracilibacteria bacterium]MDQ7022717.1 hypothetical protein [Candidatus Gracilibacteria bacterium]